MLIANQDVAVFTWADRLAPFLRHGVKLGRLGKVPTSKPSRESEGLRANIYYFSHPKWTADWLTGVHRDARLRERWHAAAGTWDGKVVVDVGCGPGNLYANLGGTPAALIGVDVAPGSLRMAEEQGYAPLLADAQDMPLATGCADVVALNATVHHCDDMQAVIRESARLVKSGGVIVIDHDPQLSAWEYRGVGRFLWALRKPMYRWLKRKSSADEVSEQEWAEETKVHHRPGDGLTEELLRRTLEPMGFEVKIYPHNLTVGREILDGEMGHKALKFRVGQVLSGINPDSRQAALSLMCVARRRDAAEMMVA